MRSEQLKRKPILSTVLSSEEEETGLFYLVEYLVAPYQNQISVLSERLIRIANQTNTEGRVRHLGKSYEVRIIYMGTESSCQHKSNNYSENLQLTTESEECTSKKAKCKYKIVYTFS